jgi:hypothetical protein
MSDVGGPDQALARKQIEVQIGQLNQNKLAAELRVMQLDSERTQAVNNMAAIDISIAELQEKLNARPPDQE